MQTRQTVSIEAGQALAQEMGLAFMEVSARHNINVQQAFLALIRDIKRRLIDCNTEELSRALLDSAREGNTSQVQYLLASHANVDTVGPERNTPLLNAARRGHYHVAEVLISRQANINCTDIGNNSPLHVAALNGHIAVVKLLVDCGADRSMRNVRSRVDAACCCCCSRQLRLTRCCRVLASRDSLVAPPLK